MKLTPAELDARQASLFALLAQRGCYYRGEPTGETTEEIERRVQKQERVRRQPREGARWRRKNA